MLEYLIRIRNDIYQPWVTHLHDIVCNINKLFVTYNYSAIFIVLHIIRNNIFPTVKVFIRSFRHGANPVRLRFRTLYARYPTLTKGYRNVPLLISILLYAPQVIRGVVRWFSENVQI
jgi:hypothetical protein